METMAVGELVSNNSCSLGFFIVLLENNTPPTHDKKTLDKKIQPLKSAQTVRTQSNNRDPPTQTNRCKNRKKNSSEPAREARRRPGCCFELRRAKRAGAQTGIRLPRACTRPQEIRKCQPLKTNPGNSRKCTAHRKMKKLRIKNLSP